MDEGIIDLSQWVAEREDRQRTATFAVWGGEGERSRFALPVWRTIYLLHGVRGGVVWTGAGDRGVQPFFVLDLGAEPARTEFSPEISSQLRDREPPALALSEGIAAVLLARTADRTWFLLVAGEEVGEDEPDRRSREDLLFLAGECAGLLLHRGLGDEE